MTGKFNFCPFHVTFCPFEVAELSPYCIVKMILHVYPFIYNCRNHRDHNHGSNDHNYASDDHNNDDNNGIRYTKKYFYLFQVNSCLFRLIQLLSLNLTGHSYKKIYNQHGCCTSSTTYHERCHVSGPLSGCKEACDVDDQCKGYVASGSNCQFATTSDCPAKYRKYNVGSVGEISEQGTCGGGYGGCFIKTFSGKYSILIHL